MAAESALALVPSPTDTAKALGDLLVAREKVLEQIRKHQAEYEAKRNAQVRDLANEAVKNFNMQGFMTKQTALQTLDDQYKKEHDALKALIAKFDVLIEGYLKEAPAEARQLLNARLEALQERRQDDVDAFDEQIKTLRGWLKKVHGKKGDYEADDGGAKRKGKGKRKGSPRSRQNTGAKA